LSKILISTSSFNVKDNKPLSNLKKNGYEHLLNPYGRRLTEIEVMELLQEDVVGMIAGVEPLTRKVLMEAGNLKVLSRCGIGMDNVDLEAARELDILVYNTPAAPIIAVAELTIAIILVLIRKITQADRNIREGKWKAMMGNLLASQTVGVIGYGRIGKRVSQLLHAFGSKIIVYDKHEVSLEADFKFYTMDEVLELADIVTLHVPYEASTHHLINKDKLALMKPGAMLVNTSRGGLVDEQALLSSLQSGQLAGAGLDAFEEEPYKGPLCSLPQVILTAHMGSYAREARTQMELEAAENLIKGFQEKGIDIERTSK
jgi:D-3-phosphoglycerate dehydrogenase